MTDNINLHLRELVETYRDTNKSEREREACFREVFLSLLDKVEGYIRNCCSIYYYLFFGGKSSNKEDSEDKEQNEENQTVIIKSGDTMDPWFSIYGMVLKKCFETWDFDIYEERQALKYFWVWLKRKIIAIIEAEKKRIKDTMPIDADTDEYSDQDGLSLGEIIPDPNSDTETESFEKGFWVEKCQALADVVFAFRSVSLVKDAGAEKRVKLLPKAREEEMQHNFIVRDGNIIYHTQKVNSTSRKATANYFPCFFASDLCALAKYDKSVWDDVDKSYSKYYRPAIDENLLRYVTIPSSNQTENPILDALRIGLKRKKDFPTWELRRDENPNDPCDLPLPAPVTFEYTKSESCPFSTNSLVQSAYYEKRHLYASLLDALLRDERSMLLTYMKLQYENKPDDKEEATP